MAYVAVTSLIGTLHLTFLQSEPRLPLEDLESQIRDGNENIELLQEILEDLEAESSKDSTKRLRNKGKGSSHSGSPIVLTSLLRKVGEVKQNIVSLHENLVLLQQFIDKSEIAHDYAAMKDLEAQIRDVSQKAEERIEMELSSFYVAKGQRGFFSLGNGGVKDNLLITACLLRLRVVFNEAVKQTDELKKKFNKMISEYQLTKDPGKGSTTRVYREKGESPGKGPTTRVYREQGESSEKGLTTRVYRNQGKGPGKGPTTRVYREQGKGPEKGPTTRVYREQAFSFHFDKRLPLRLKPVTSQSHGNTVTCAPRLPLGKGSSQNERISLIGSTTSSRPDLEDENITVSKFLKNTSKFDSRIMASAKRDPGKSPTTRVYREQTILCHFDKRPSPRLKSVTSQSHGNTVTGAPRLPFGKGSSQNERISLIGSTTSSRPDLEDENITVSKFLKNTSKFDCRIMASAKGGPGKDPTTRVYREQAFSYHFDKRPPPRLKSVTSQSHGNTVTGAPRLPFGKGSSQNERISLIGSTTSSRPDLEDENITVSKFLKNTSKFDSRIMVGCDKEFMTILDQLTRESESAKHRQVVSIAGMGGIGKTTLARKVYEDPSITSRFDKQAWTTVSQEYNVGQMLQCLIDCVSEASGDEQSNHQEDQLAESLYKRLKGQRYLIVIDDIWSTNAWDSVQRCFPDDSNGSRLLLTSRLREVAEYASSGNSPIDMPFLDADESWNLYCKVFGKTAFPFEFDRIGRDIVKKCEGLPLAIIVVASLLSKTEEVVEKWKNVTEFVIGDSYEACSTMLSLSYNHLPCHLKACFLYFGVFPEDYEIPVKKLVRLWAAEGFLEGVNHQNMEEVAMECLQDLVDRSLVIVSKRSYNEEMKTVRIHDLLRELCLREARCENLLNVIGNPDHGAVVGRFMLSKPCPWISISPRCFNIANGFQFRAKFHSLHCFDFVDLRIKVFCSFKLLRVVDMKLGFWNFGGGKVLNTESLVHLRYLALSLNGKASRLQLQLFEHWNMQSFIIRGNGTFDPSRAYRIWKMPMLRNFYVEGIPFSLETSEVVHRHLKTIYWLAPERCTKDLFTMTPNLKELGIDNGLFSSEYSDCFYNFVHLGKLEKLSIKYLGLEHITFSGIPWATSFLPNLKKLNFERTGLPWSKMEFIGMLPNLEVLKLIDTWSGQEWEPCEGGFCRLKRLVIGDAKLKYWNAVGDHFPVLECLELHKCYSLREIPSGFADITTLALIQLNDCLDSVLASAKWIQEEQHSYGNDAFLVRSKHIHKRETSEHSRKDVSDVEEDCE